MFFSSKWISLLWLFCYSTWNNNMMIRISAYPWEHNFVSLSILKWYTFLENSWGNPTPIIACITCYTLTCMSLYSNTCLCAVTRMPFLLSHCHMHVFVLSHVHMLVFIPSHCHMVLCIFHVFGVVFTFFHHAMCCMERNITTPFPSMFSQPLVERVLFFLGLCIYNHCNTTLLLLQWQPSP